MAVMIDFDDMTGICIFVNVCDHVLIQIFYLHRILSSWLDDLVASILATTDLSSNSMRQASTISIG